MTLFVEPLARTEVPEYLIEIDYESRTFAEAFYGF